ncbi:two-component system response regulator RppA [Stenomitos frigidus]|uniref:DNA-binding response regulator n=1 Tax=Stenomitos frigidus ULC18 TaxID=2107698 RepID=A0A2T1ECJ6_9CYAN|nr:two-component system response regulator RppA [Stenomitos frigidus]PSB30434.1 DNA-binding response regulator [Stenomitos frigidus ULC18]
MLILLVEDDPAQLEPLQTALLQAGHIVDAIDDGETAQWLMSQKEYDLLILDWMLPKISGVNLCQQYRQSGKTAPVLMLTAKDTIADKVTGLDAGADDYLVKPIDVVELLARVRALRRRSPLWQGDSLSLDALHLHLNTLTLECHQLTTPLSSREFQLMEYLMRHPRQVLSHHQIEQALWGWGTEPESNAVTTLVRRLRQRLQAVNAKDWLETIYGMGYRLQPPERGRGVGSGE